MMACNTVAALKERATASLLKNIEYSNEVESHAERHHLYHNGIDAFARHKLSILLISFIASYKRR